MELLPAKQHSKAQALANDLQDNWPSLSKVLPRQIGPDRMLRVMLSALETTPDLLNCEPKTILGCLLQCVSLGLEPNTPQGLAYLVPFKKNRGRPNETKICTLIVGYKGFLDLAYRSGLVEAITAHVVFENDEIDVSYGTEERITHKPSLEGKNRGSAIGAYCVMHLKNGGKITRFLPKDEILAARPPNWKYTPWNDQRDYVVWEMYQKTAIRRTLKTGPLSPEMRIAVVSDEAAERGVGWNVSKDMREISLDQEEETKALPPSPPPPPPDPTPENDAETNKRFTALIQTLPKGSADFLRHVGWLTSSQDLEDLAVANKKQILERPDAFRTKVEDYMKEQSNAATS